MWRTIQPPPGGLRLYNGDTRTLRGLVHEAAAASLHTHPEGTTLVADGGHWINPHRIGAWHRTHGRPADWQAQRLLVGRSMTAYQWETRLTDDLATTVTLHDAHLLLAAPFDGLLCHPELTDYERDQLPDAVLASMQQTATRHDLRIGLFCDMQRLWHTHPLLARTIMDRVPDRHHVEATPHGYRITHEPTATVTWEPPATRPTLDRYLPEPLVPAPGTRPPLVVPPTRRQNPTSPAPRSRRTPPTRRPQQPANPAPPPSPTAHPLLGGETPWA